VGVVFDRVWKSLLSLGEREAFAFRGLVAFVLMWKSLLSVISYTTVLASSAPLHELQEIGRLPTEGCNGLEFFTINQVDYLVAANFWDGKSAEMSANSALFRLSLVNNSRNIQTEIIQQFSTKGAHGADYFVHGDYNMLSIPSYYGCQQQDDAGCYSTVLYLWDHVRSKFVVFQQFKTAGPSQTDHLVEEGNGGAVFFFVAENFSSRLSVYRFESAGPPRFEHYQNIFCPGVAGLAVLQVQQRSLLAVASYHDKGWKTSSLVLAKESGRGRKFKKMQSLDTFGAHDAEMALLNDRVLLFFSEDRNDSSSKISSQLFSLSLSLSLSLPEASSFVKVQDLSTDGAHAAEFFFSSSSPSPSPSPSSSASSELHLAVANFGDRQGERVEARSSLWRWDDSAARLVLVHEVETQGATDWEHLALSSASSSSALAYLIVCNEGDIGKQLHQESVFYRLVGGGRGRVDGEL
jgi:hypothetical protein